MSGEVSGEVSANASEPAQRPNRRTRQRAPTQQTQQTQQTGRVAPQRRTEQAQEEAAGDVEDVDDLREQVWMLHLRGVSMRQIALRLDLNRKVVARLLGECERAFGAERRARLKRKLERAIAGLRHVQAQAWDDHDSDEASQKSAHLRLALDAEKEIARLEGLYAGDVSDLAAVLFSVERVVGGVVMQHHAGGQRTPAPAVEESNGA